MATAGILLRGRESFERQEWADAYARLSQADQAAPLEPEDLELLATTAYLLGRDDESAEIRGRAHHDFLSRGDDERAARSAIWLGLGLLMKGERARGGGWIARARRLLDDGRRDCVERGYLLVPAALRSLAEGDAAQAHAAFVQAAEIAERYGDPDLAALGRLGRGQALLRMGDVAEGVAFLDEAMAAAEAQELSPIVVGIVYCAVIEACREIFDLRRAREWTDALTRWCESQPDLVPYRGQCLVRRAEIMQLHGEWPDAMDEAKRACDLLVGPPGEPAAGSAFYQRAEIHRLRGEFAEAEAAYGQASRWGRRPEPGLALLRLAQGRIDAAEAAVRRMVDEARDRWTRTSVLPACVEIMLAGGDGEAARTAADELAEIAADVDAPLLHALAAQAQGAVALEDGDARAALEHLRRAWSIWGQLEAPYEAARVRTLMGLACGELGDRDTGQMELEAARRTFRELGAAPDLARLESLTGRGPSRDTHGLTPRELEVLRRVAAGGTNKAIAAELFISERTVERHVSNIFTKLRVSSRAAATAYAYEHQLV